MESDRYGRIDLAFAIALMIGPVTYVKQCLAGAPVLRPVDKSPEIPNEWRFEPHWRGQGDCGPLSLYVLMRLQGHPVSVEAVKGVVPFDGSTGCSMADLARDADALGYAVDIRFVNQRDLTSLPGPFILHVNGSLQTGVGHYAIIVDYDREKRLFSVIDTTFEKHSQWREDVLLHGFSGYVLLPATKFWGSWKPLVLLACSLCVLGVVCKRVLSQGMTDKSRIPSTPRATQ